MGLQSARLAAASLLDEPLAAPNRLLYAVLDGARHRDVHELVTTSGRPAMCLFRGPIDRELERNAPWLVRLDRDSPVSREIILEAWGKSWGIFCETTVDVPVLGRHLRGFLRVLSPDGKKLLFRYYDPRVWRLFLPTLTAEEARRFSGPVRRFLTESEDGDALLEDVESATGMVRRTLRLVPGATWDGPASAVA